MKTKAMLLLVLILMQPLAYAAGWTISGDPNSLTPGQALYFQGTPFASSAGVLGDVTGDSRDDIIGKCVDNAPFFNCLCVIRGRQLTTTIATPSVDRLYCHENSSGSRFIGVPRFRAKLIINEPEDRLFFSNAFQSLRIASGTLTTKYTFCLDNAVRMGDLNSDGAEELWFHNSGEAKMRVGHSVWQEEFPCLQITPITGFAPGSSFAYLGDVTGDGAGDFSISSQGKVVVHRGNSGLNVSFSLGYGFRFTPESAQLTLLEDFGDFDGDGFGETVGIREIGGQRQVIVLPGPVQLDPEPIELDSMVPSRFVRVAARAGYTIDRARSIGDWTGDGRADLAVELIADSQAIHGVIIVPLEAIVANELILDFGPPDGTILITEATLSSQSVRKVDFDGDGRQDYVNEIQTGPGWLVVRGQRTDLFRDGFEPQVNP